jgi:hypothetical protein
MHYIDKLNRMIANALDPALTRKGLIQALREIQDFINGDDDDLDDVERNSANVDHSPTNTYHIDRVAGMLSAALDPVLTREEVVQRLQEIDDFINVADAIPYESRRANGRSARNNPPVSGAENLGAWMNAVQSMRGDPGGDMSVSEAVALVQATPPEQRSEFAKQIWSIRRKKYGPTGHNKVPF